MHRDNLLLFESYKNNYNLLDNYSYKGKYDYRENVRGKLIHIKVNSLNIILPTYVKSLTFGTFFDRKIKDLPSSLTHLTFGYDFNQEIQNLPASLTHLTLSKTIKKNKKLPNLVIVELI